MESTSQFGLFQMSSNMLVRHLVQASPKEVRFLQEVSSRKTQIILFEEDDLPLPPSTLCPRQLTRLFDDACELDNRTG
jgi:hypothetical protein